MKQVEKAIRNADEHLFDNPLYKYLRDTIETREILIEKIKEDSHSNFLKILGQDYIDELYKLKTDLNNLMKEYKN